MRGGELRIFLNFRCLREAVDGGEERERERERKRLTSETRHEEQKEDNRRLAMGLVKMKLCVVM